MGINYRKKNKCTWHYKFASKEPKVTVIIRPIREFFAERLPSVSGAEGKSWVAKNYHHEVETVLKFRTVADT